MKKKKALTNIFISGYFKVIVILASILICVWFFSIPLSRFNTTDPIPSFSPITVKEERSFGYFKTRVFTGLFIKTFPYFNMKENKFIFDGFVWFEFNTDEQMLPTIEKFAFENGSILRKSLPDVKIVGDKTFVKYNISVEIKGNIEYFKFPLEDHRLSIILTNNFVTPYEFVFNVLNTSFVVDKEANVSNWIIRNLTTNFGYKENLFDQADMTKSILKPIALFTIDFTKAGIKTALIIFIPIFLAFLLALFSFLLLINNFIGRATLSVSSLTALLGYRFVIQTLMPKVHYFTTVDYVYLTLLFMAFIIFIFQTLLGRKAAEIKTIKKQSESTKIQNAFLRRLIVFDNIAFYTVIGLFLSLIGFFVI